MKKNNDFFSELIVGVFMVAVLSLLGYFTIVISGVDLLTGRERVHATVEFTDVGGLKERDNVIYRGMKVGAVERIALGPGHVMVTLYVDKDVVLREKCFITVEAMSLLGGNFLLIEEGTGAKMPLESTVFKGTPPADWMRDLGQIARNLNDLITEGGVKNIISNFDAMSSKMQLVTERIERGEGTLGKLLSTNDQVYVDLASTVASARALVGRVERGEGTAGKLLSTNDQIYADIASTLASAKTVAGRLERGEGTAGKLLSDDDTVYQDVKRTFARAAEMSQTLSERLEKGEGTIGRLLSKDDSLYRDLQGSIANVKAITQRISSGEGLLGRATQDKALADDAEKLLSNLKDVSEKLAKGDGTLGKVVNDPQLYNEVNGLIKDVRQVVDNYRDTTPISSFAGLVGGAL